MATFKKICAWCQTELGSVEGTAEYANPITHGICESCTDKILQELDGSENTALDRLDVPILLFEGSAQVTGGNKSARNILGKELPEIRGKLVGNVLECVYSLSKEGCGETDHCKGCMVRKAITATLTTGNPELQKVAYTDIKTADDQASVIIKITTQKLGNFVLLRIDNLSEGSSEK